MFKEISKKQALVYQAPYIAEKLGYDTFVLDGAVRTGKTDFGFKGYVDWFLDTLKYFNHNRQNGYNKMFVFATTLDNCKENLIEPIIEYLIDKGYHKCDRLNDLSKGNYRVYDNIQMSNLYIKYGSHTARIKYFGANNIGAIKRVQGKTFRCAFGDEGALTDIVIIETVQQRMLSFLNNHSMFGITTNPEGGDDHWFYKKFLTDCSLKGILNISLELLDNPMFTQEDEDKLSKIYTRDMFLRKIKGLWIRAAGAIYSNFKDSHVCKLNYKEDYSKHSIGIDYGNSDATVFTHIAILGNYRGLDVLSEWYHKDDEYNEKLITDKVDDFFAYASNIYNRVKHPIFVNCESSADGISFYRLLKARQVLKGIKWMKIGKVNKTQRDPKEKSAIEERITTLIEMLGSNYIRINVDCVNLISAIKNAIRDKKGNRKDDTTTNIDSLDSLEYAFIEDMQSIRKIIEYTLEVRK